VHRDARHDLGKRKERKKRLDLFSHSFPKCLASSVLLFNKVALEKDVNVLADG